MNKSHWKHLCAVLAIFLLIGCQDMWDPDADSGAWAIYRLNDPTLTTYQIRNEPLSTLQLAPLPFITVQDIEVYHWKSHTFQCTRKVSDMLDSLARYGGSTQGRPFVVSINREPIYLGTFWWGYSSTMPCAPYVDILFAGRNQSCTIEAPPPALYADPRSDMRLYNALRRAHALSEE